MITFRLYGLPVPQGSTRAFLVKGRPVVTHASTKVKPWRQDVAASARAAGATMLEGPVRVGVTFWLPRPASRRKAETRPDRRPDLDKLVRAILDALTGIAYSDDGQVVELVAGKEYATDRAPVGATISVSGPSAFREPPA